jgi:hypothetical protein
MAEKKANSAVNKLVLIEFVKNVNLNIPKLDTIKSNRP